MSRVSKKVKKEIVKAEKKARKEVLKPQKKKRKVVKREVERRNPSGSWIKDEWGKQGEVFFDGYRYWGISSNMVSGSWSSEEWEKRKKPQQKLGTSVTEEPLSSTPKITKSTKSSKQEPKGKSPTKSERLHVPRQEKWR